MASLQQKQRECSVAQWEDNWTLVAVNPLGQYSITDSAEIRHRGRWLCLSLSYSSDGNTKCRYDPSKISPQFTDSLSFIITHFLPSATSSARKPDLCHPCLECHCNVAVEAQQLFLFGSFLPGRAYLPGA